MNTSLVLNRGPAEYCNFSIIMSNDNKKICLPGVYRAMHFSAKRGIAIACRLSVCLSVRNVEVL